MTTLARPNPRPIVIGLSATPWARGLGKHYQRLVKSASTAALIQGGYLVPFRVYAPSRPDLNGLKDSGCDYHEGQLAERMNKPFLTADIVKTWLELGKGRPTLCFATNRAHAQALRDLFEAFGVRVAYVDAYTPRTDRDAIGRQLAAGDIEVVVNIGTLTTGIDWEVRCIILARPTKSESLFVQMIGRGLRTALGKQDCIILDHSDTHQRLGFVTDIDHHELDDGKLTRQQKRETVKTPPLPKCCTACAALVPVGERTCIECGQDMPRPVKIATVDGELVELGPNGTRASGRRKTTALAKRSKQEVYAELLHIRCERGKAYGWIAHTYRDIFGCWPRGIPTQIAPREPSPEVLNFVKHKAIAFAKSRQSQPMEATHGTA